MEIFKMVYEIKKKGEIEICDSSFLNRNKRRIRLVLENKIVPLMNKYSIADEKIKKLKIKFIILNKQKLNVKSMFKGCSSLKEFHAITYNKKSRYIMNLYENTKIDN